MNRVIIDGAGAVLGRLASYAAKQALLGKEVLIVGCGKVMLSGNPRTAINEYKQAVTRGGAALKGPFYPKRHSEKFVKRAIRGMLSHKEGRGEAAFDRIRCYTDTPKELENEKKILMIKKMTHKSMTISDLLKEL